MTGITLAHTRGRTILCDIERTRLSIEPMRAFFTLVTTESSGQLFDGIDVASFRDGGFFRTVVAQGRPQLPIDEELTKAPTERPRPTE